MKNFTLRLSTLILAGSLGFGMASCTSETATNPTGGTPSGVMATSKANNMIGVMWTRSSDDTSPDTLLYTDQTTNVTTPIATTSTATQMNFTGVQGHMYTIAVASANGRSSSITWMTAVRTSAIRLWDVADVTPGHYSALQLNAGNGIAQAISFSGSNLKNTVDFVLDDSISIYNPSGLVFETADVWDYSYRPTRLDSFAVYVAGGLDNAYSTDLSNFISVNGTTRPGRTAYFIPDVAEPGAKILVARTPDGNFAKIAVLQQPDGKMYGISGGHKFIDVDVSYQTVANMPYAARPIPVNGKHLRVPRIPVE